MCRSACRPGDPAHSHACHRRHRRKTRFPMAVMSTEVARRPRDRVFDHVCVAGSSVRGQSSKLSVDHVIAGKKNSFEPAHARWLGSTCGSTMDVPAWGSGRLPQGGAVHPGRRRQTRRSRRARRSIRAMTVSGPRPDLSALLKHGSGFGHGSQRRVRVRSSGQGNHRQQHSAAAAVRPQRTTFDSRIEVLHHVRGGPGPIGDPELAAVGSVIRGRRPCLRPV